MFSYCLEPWHSSSWTTGKAIGSTNIPQRVHVPNNKVLWIWVTVIIVQVLGKYMGDCQNYGPFLGPDYNTGPNTGPNLGDPKRDHNFDNSPYDYWVLGPLRFHVVHRGVFPQRP